MRVWMWPRCFQRLADRADAAVHHVAGRDDVHAGLGLGQRLPHQHFHRLVVQDVAGVVEQAVLAVAGEGVERHVGHHAQLAGSCFFSSRTTRGTRPSRVPGFAAVRRLERGIDHREQRHRRDAELHALLGHRQQQVEAQALHAGHGGHRLRAASGRPARTPGRSGRGRVSACSRTRLRVNSSRRSRRGRPCGKGAWRLMAKIVPHRPSHRAGRVAAWSQRSARADASVADMALGLKRRARRLLNYALGGLPLPAFPP